MAEQQQGKTYVAEEVVPFKIIPKQADTRKIRNIRAIPGLIRSEVIPSSAGFVYGSV